MIQSSGLTINPSDTTMAIATKAMHLNDWTKLNMLFAVVYSKWKTKSVSLKKLNRIKIKYRDVLKAIILRNSLFITSLYCMVKCQR